MIKVTAIECPLCGDIIYSRARHDFRWCSCETIAIDGGLDYTKVSYDSEKVPSPQTHAIELPITREELYFDWNHAKDKFGLVKPCGEPLSSAKFVGGTDV